MGHETQEMFTRSLEHFLIFLGSMDSSLIHYKPAYQEICTHKQKFMYNVRKFTNVIYASILN